MNKFSFRSARRAHQRLLAQKPGSGGAKCWNPVTGARALWSISRYVLGLTSTFNANEIERLNFNRLRQCLVTSKFQKFYKILRHIKSLDVETNLLSLVSP
jgi:hypothetical protein